MVLPHSLRLTLDRFDKDRFGEGKFLLTDIGAGQPGHGRQSLGVVVSEFPALHRQQKFLDLH